MTFGDGIAFAALMGVISFIAWLRSKRHQHKWKEVSRDEAVRSDNKASIGFRSYCVCEECGEQRHFNLY